MAVHHSTSPLDPSQPSFLRSRRDGFAALPAFRPLATFTAPALACEPGRGVYACSRDDHALRSDSWGQPCTRRKTCPIGAHLTHQVTSAR